MSESNRSPLVKKSSRGLGDLRNQFERSEKTPNVEPEKSSASK